MKLFVGNLDLKATSDDLDVVFRAYGTVVAATVARNFATGEGHGYGFVEMTNDHEAIAAIEHLDGFELNDRPLRVLRRWEPSA